MRGFVIHCVLLLFILWSLQHWPGRRVNEEPVVLAAISGNASALERAVARGLDVNRDDGVLLRSAALHGRLDTVETLLRLGAEPNTKRDMVSAIACAAACGHTAVVQRLLEAGADPCIVTTAGESALMAAEREAHLETAKLLRDWHARRERSERPVGEPGERSTAQCSSFIPAARKPRSLRRGTRGLTHLSMTEELLASQKANWN